MGVETFQPLSSSNIAEVSYDSESEDLTIRFQDGSRYLYRNVPRATYRGLTLAPSVGSYFHRHVKGRYMTETV